MAMNGDKLLLIQGQIQMILTASLALFPGYWPSDRRHLADLARKKAIMILGHHVVIWRESVEQVMSYSISIMQPCTW